jgi:hypothetical protein
MLKAAASARQSRRIVYLTLHALNVEVFDSVKSKQAILTFNTLPFSNTAYDVIIGLSVVMWSTSLHLNKMSTPDLAILYHEIPRMKATPKYQH